MRGTRGRRFRTLTARECMGVARVAAARRQNPLLFEDIRTPERIKEFHRVGRDSTGFGSVRGFEESALSDAPIHLNTRSRKARFKLLAGPNQGGKTWAGAREALWSMLGVHPFRHVKKGPVHGWVICYSKKQSISIQKALNTLVPKHLVVNYDFNDTRGFLNQTLKVRCGPGANDVSILEIKTAGQDTLGLASATLDFIWIDEPPPQEIWSELVARLLVKKGELWITMTPIGRPVEYLKEMCEKGQIHYSRFILSVDECPHLAQEQIDETLLGYLEAEQPQRIYGLWEGVTPDRYISAFDPMKNLSSRLPKGKVQVGVSIDHGEGPGKEVAILYAWIPDDWFPTGWVIDEYVSPKPTGPEEDAIGILDMLERNDVDLPWVNRWTGDVNTMGKSQAGVMVNTALGYHIAQEYARRKGIPPNVLPPVVIDSARKNPGSISLGCRVLNYGFARQDLWINPRCKRVKKSLQHWRGGNTGEDGQLKDGIDVLRYGPGECFAGSQGYARLILE